MILTDDLYGSFDISEPVIEKLINSSTFVRLKDITQAGVPQKYNSLKVYSRYEHSVGVMLLLRTLGAKIEEQVAGLLHDISHLAFSHVAEWVFQEDGNLSESMNETLTEKFIYDSEIKEILIESKINPDLIIDLKKFNLLKSEIPDVNADRGDYSLREIYKWRDKKTAGKILNELEVIDGKIVIKEIEIAKIYATEFLVLQTNYWGGHDAVLRYYLFSEVLKYLVNNGMLKIEDFYSGELEILKKLEKVKNNKIKEYLTILRKKDLTEYRKYFGKTIKKKFRYIDPFVQQDGKITRLSKVDNNFKKLLKKEMLKSQLGIEI